MKRLMLMTGLAILAASAFAADKSDKKDLTELYKDKYLAVLREGLAVGVLRDRPSSTVRFAVRIDGDKVDYAEHGFVKMLDSTALVAIPIHKGDVLLVRGVSTSHLGVTLNVQTVRSVQRGLGAFEHQSVESARASFRFASTDDVQKWVKAFDTQDEAAQLGNTASGIYVNQVKAGMTFAEVEAALGPPSTRVDLGEKVLYKY